MAWCSVLSTCRGGAQRCLTTLWVWKEDHHHEHQVPFNNQIKWHNIPRRSPLCEPILSSPNTAGRGPQPPEGSATSMQVSTPLQLSTPPPDHQGSGLSPTPLTGPITENICPTLHGAGHLVQIPPPSVSDHITANHAPTTSNSTLEVTRPSHV